jgi:hypothetical protein
MLIMWDIRNESKATWLYFGMKLVNTYFEDEQGDGAADDYNHIDDEKNVRFWPLPYALSLSLPPPPLSLNFSKF